MQQTEKYKFKIIQTSDTFSPDALNANAEAVEAEVARVEAETETRLAALADDVGFGTPGKVARIAWGAYTGTGKAQTLTFDFKPVLVIVLQSFSASFGGDRPYAAAPLVRSANSVYGTTFTGSYTCGSIVWTDDSVTFAGNFVTEGKAGLYFALGVSLDGE